MCVARIATKGKGVKIHSAVMGGRFHSVFCRELKRIKNYCSMSLELLIYVCAIVFIIVYLFEKPF